MSITSARKSLNGRSTISLGHPSSVPRLSGTYDRTNGGGHSIPSRRPSSQNVPCSINHCPSARTARPRKEAHDRCTRRRATVDTRAPERFATLVAFLQSVGVDVEEFISANYERVR